MTTVVTYQLAYLTGHRVSLCSTCVALDDHGLGALGPVSHGAHRGECGGASHGRDTAVRVSPAQIRALRTEAGAAGDSAQAAICTRALDGDADARRECARVIADAAAQS